MSELNEAKRKLMYLLLKKPEKEMTDSEVNIGYELAQDEYIKALLIHIKEREEIDKMI